VSNFAAAELCCPAARLKKDAKIKRRFGRDLRDEQDWESRWIDNGFTAASNPSEYPQPRFFKTT